MSAGMPELGSKISLISKADIRYEGRLFTVDPQECTIALANVRSFGTEDRETPYPIMPQPTVYDYILFRGSDIKDIRVVNNVAIPNDPAIMQMHLPPGQGLPQQQNFPPQNFPPGGAGPQMGQFGPFSGMQGGNMGMPQGGNMPQPQAQSPVQQGNNNNNNLAPGSGSGQNNKKTNSRSGTPQNARKSPSSDLGNQNNQRGDGQANKEKPQRNNQRNNQQQRERRDSARNENQENNKGGYRNQNQNQRPNNNQMNNQQQNRGGYRDNNRDNNRNQGGDNRDNRNQGGNQMRGNNQGGSVRMRGPPMHMNNYRQQNNQGAPNQNKPNQNAGQQQNRGNNKQTKFDSEFDFEQANSKFEEFRSQFNKLKVGDDQKAPEQVNGEAEKKDDSGNETGADNHEVETDETAYDKNKSFFDNISCEAVERSKGKTQRTDWRQERKINSETFGYAFNRRGNYRGRGGYYQGQYNRGQRQLGYRGGNPNYRPMRNHRNQNNANGNPGNGQPQQSQNQSAPVAAAN